MSVQSDNLSSFNFRPAQGDQPENAPVDGDPSPSTDDLETLRAELAELEQKADEYLRLAQRTQADFINYRRRTEEERAQQARDANVAFLQRLLPVLDDFERALSSATPDDLESSWGKGILLVDRMSPADKLKNRAALDELVADYKRGSQSAAARSR